MERRGAKRQLLAMCPNFGDTSAFVSHPINGHSHERQRSCLRFDWHFSLSSPCRGWTAERVRGLRSTTNRRRSFGLHKFFGTVYMIETLTFCILTKQCKCMDTTYDARCSALPQERKRHTRIPHRKARQTMT